MNRIDLSKYEIRTDLIIENNNIKNDYLDEEIINDDLKVTTVNIDNDKSNILKKKKGTYITIEFTDITNYEDREKVKEVLIKQLKKILEFSNIKEKDSCLIIGLGNRKSTADSLGPKVIDKITVTRHLFILNTNIKEGFRNVSAISPGVMADTGIETYDTITSIINIIKPKFLIVIDSLASSSIDRINKTIQITNTGIHPGSGVGNNRKELSKETLNIPVIAIGVPTVVDAITIVNDTTNYLFKHLSYIKNNYQINKLIFSRGKNYKNDINKTDLSLNEKKEISGILGGLSNEDKKNLIGEVLNSLNYNFIVTPKEIDFLIDNLTNVISDALNHSLHKEI